MNNIYNLDYLQNLIENQIEESLHLEYKASGALGKEDKKKFDISKDVSAMANSDGGILIYGITEDQSNRHLPIGIEAIKRKELPKEWLEQIIQDNIQPRINGIQIFTISIGIEGVVYVVDIPKSNTAHQATDKRYYKRFNFNSVPMHDYEIRDVLNRAKNPDIELKFELTNKKRDELHVIAYNQGAVYAKYINVKIRLPEKIVVRQQHHKLLNNGMIEIFAKNTIRELVNPYGAVGTFWPTRYEPILPQTSIKLTKISLHNNPFIYENILEWDIFCDNANPVSGSIRLVDLIKQ